MSLHYDNQSNLAIFISSERTNAGEPVMPYLMDTVTERLYSHGHNVDYITGQDLLETILNCSNIGRNTTSLTHTYSEWRHRNLGDIDRALFLFEQATPDEVNQNDSVVILDQDKRDSYTLNVIASINLGKANAVNDFLNNGPLDPEAWRHMEERAQNPTGKLWALLERNLDLNATDSFIRTLEMHPALNSAVTRSKINDEEVITITLDQKLAKYLHQQEAESVLSETLSVWPLETVLNEQELVSTVIENGLSRMIEVRNQAKVLVEKEPERWGSPTVNFNIDSRAIYSIAIEDSNGPLDGKSPKTFRAELVLSDLLRMHGYKGYEYESLSSLPENVLNELKVELLSRGIITRDLISLPIDELVHRIFPPEEIIRNVPELITARDQNGGILGNPEAGRKVGTVRYIVDGERMPTVQENEQALHDGIALSRMLVNQVTPVILGNENLMEALVNPFLSKQTLDYIRHYIRIHGVEQQRTVLSRADMLLTKTGLRACEVNSDAPEGHAISRAAQAIQKVLYPDRPQSVMADFFNDAHIDFLIQRGARRVLIPFWENGATSPMDAHAKAAELNNLGFQATAKAIEHLTPAEASEYDALIRTTTVTGHMFEHHNDLPYFNNDSWLALPQYPAPWTDVASLKHLFALLQSASLDEQVAKSYGLSNSDLDAVRRSMLPSYSIQFFSEEYVMELIRKKGESAFVAKGTMSSHGEGFNDGSKVHIIDMVINGTHILQERADCIGSGIITVLHPNNEISQEEKWIIDMNPMGYDRKGNICAITRGCLTHPVNIAGINGGGGYNPYHY